MRGIPLTRCVVVALFAGALACARNQETGTAAVQGDTTAMADTTGQNPPGYRGMERDTSMLPQQQQQPVDTFLQQQGVNPRADTAGYTGAERPDTTGVRQTDTAGVNRTDTTGYRQQTDTTGYQNQTDSLQLPRDTTQIRPDTGSWRP